MNIRAIFFDIDGTLLVNDSRHQMPESTLRALQMAHAKGIRLFVATGRVPSMATPLWDLFPFDGILAMTGQYCYDRSGNLLHSMPMDAEDIRRLMAIQEKQHMDAQAQARAKMEAELRERLKADTGAAFLCRGCKRHRIPCGCRCIPQAAPPSITASDFRHNNRVCQEH